MILVVVVLAASTVCAPTQYRYGNLPVEFKGRPFLISGIQVPLGTVGWIPILPSMSFVVLVLVLKKKGMKKIS
jgi:hypothetical protein